MHTQQANPTGSPQSTRGSDSAVLPMQLMSNPYTFCHQSIFSVLEEGEKGGTQDANFVEARWQCGVT